MVPSPSLTQTPSLKTVTPSPMLTLNQSERQLYLEERLPTNNGCKLPCWLGITPGKTTWQEAQSFIQYLGIDRIRGTEKENGEILYGFGGFDFDAPRLLHTFGVLVKNDIVKGISLMVEGYQAPKDFQKIWTYYSPTNIMVVLGSPSEIWFSTTSETVGNRHGYDLILVFDDDGTIIHYHGFLTEIGTSFQICPRFEGEKDIQHIVVYIQSPEDPKPLDEFGGVLDRQFLIDRSKRISDAVGLSEEEFYELSTHNEQGACFESPINIWPQFFNP
jgi:hypothetical protein